MSIAAPTVFAPPALPMPQPMLWTVAEFHSILGEPWAERRRLILVEGVILQMPIPNPPHNASVGLTEEALRNAFGVGFWIRTQMPLVLGAATDPMPDVAVLRGSPRDYSNVQPRTALVVEVAESTLSFDKNQKANLYAAGGMQEYWVVDLVHRVLLVFRDPASDPHEEFGATYRSKVTLAPDQRISPLAAQTAQVLVADLLP